ncbi:hypothetical protein J5F27_03255 [Schleiferilactobacillus harbinensis]|jgi:hypothetical protein|uniref:hypothetical protein n=1 Tax=Schleiferilactobacillus harbinensis TaxID=304207 RepID=UPI001AAE6488|nr:hypothetical protein [Schleiferilactobacillus harbinensis]MBO3090935.1 hypothetical protein [Schleiferilactobacillus harbinensis]
MFSFIVQHKQRCFSYLLVLLTALIFLAPSTDHVNASSNDTCSANNSNTVIKKLKTDKLDLVGNYTNIITLTELKKANFISAYQVKDTTSDRSTGVLNYLNKSTNVYYNVYLAPDATINYVTKQYNNGNGTYGFDILYYNEQTKELDNVYHDDFDSQLNATSNLLETRAAVNKLALGWACMFSSYMACIGASAAAGVLGTVTLGPISIAGATLGGVACRYVFQHLVQKLGGKGAACSWVRNLKNTWKAIAD